MAPSRHVVASLDGTPIAVWKRGSGHPIVLVHGSMNDHTYLDGVAASLSETLTVYSLDRRGFGTSGDSPEYDLMREFEDLAVVVNDVARLEGLAPAVFGHSFGASVALGGATLTRSLTHLVLYEPSLGLRYPPGSLEAIESAVAAGEADLALSIVYKEVLQASDAELAERRADEQWARQTNTAHTVAREARAEEAWEFQPGQFDSIKVPVLFISGALSPSDVKDATTAARGALRESEMTTLESHGHSACRNDPALVASVIEEFVSRTA